MSELSICRDDRNTTNMPERTATAKTACRDSGSSRFPSLRSGECSGSQPWQARSTGVDWCTLIAFCSFVVSVIEPRRRPLKTILAFGQLQLHPSTPLHTQQNTNPLCSEGGRASRGPTTHLKLVLGRMEAFAVDKQLVQIGRGEAWLGLAPKSCEFDANSLKAANEARRCCGGSCH